jgi:hypothetical protein
VDEELRAELLARQEEDQRIRKAGKPGDRLAPAQFEEWQRIDEGNTLWLNDLVDRVGWPGTSLVGADGSQAAWLFAQHASQHPDLQRKFLGLLREAVEAGEAPPRHLAYLEDRVRVHDGRPQFYGTQFTKVVLQYRWEPFPIEDPEHVDERRAAVGLSPLAEYAAQMERDNSGGAAAD